jgi:hypothetical protein
VSLLAQDERLARGVGAVVLVVLALAIGFVVFISPEIEWGGRVRIHAFFHHTGELREGAPVIVAGRTIGHVETIALSPKDAPTPLAGKPGVDVTLVLAAADAKRVARGGDVFVAGRGPLSARHLEIGPSPAPDGPTFADDTRPVRGIDPPTMDRVMQRTWDNLMIAKRFADEIAPEFRAFRDELRRLAATMDGLVPDVVGVASLGVEVEGLFEEVRKLRAALGGDPGIARIEAVVGQARTTIAQARRTIDTLAAKAEALRASIDVVRGRVDKRAPQIVASVEAAIAKLRAAIDKIDPLLATVRDLNARIARGEGTIGKLARDPEFPEDAKDLGRILKRQPWRIFMRPKDN